MTTRSKVSEFVRIFPPIAALPKRPVKKSEILSRYNGIKGIQKQNVKGALGDSIPANNKTIQKKEIIGKLAAEVEELYGKIGVMPISRRCIVDRIEKLKNDYDKWENTKDYKGRKPFVADEFVSFLSKVQPTLKTTNEDMAWYKAKLAGEDGSLGPEDHTSSQRADRLKKLRIHQQDLDNEVVSSIDLKLTDDSHTEESQSDDGK